MQVDLGKICQLFDQTANALLASRANVVDLPRCAFFQQGQVGRDHVRDIKEVARDVDVPDLQSWCLQALLDPADLVRGAGNDEAVFLPAADMVERAGNQYGPAFAQAPLQTQELCRQFAHSIGIARAGGLQFSDGQMLFSDLAIDITGADVQKRAGEAARLEGLQQVQGAQQIDIQGAGRITKGLRDERLAGQVNHCIGHLRPQAFEARRCSKIVAVGNRQQFPFRGISLQTRLDVLSYESAQTRDKQTFFQTATPWSCISSISHRLHGKTCERHDRSNGG
ncbi:hypothetical protein D3C78_1048460 [compost metagenome]